MAARDFIDERRAVIFGGRRFVVRKPTLATVTLAVMRLGLDFAAIRRSLREAAAPISNPMTAVLAFILATQEQRDAVAEVLETCVDSDLPDGDLRLTIAADPAMAKALIAGLLEVCDAGRIAAQLNLDRLEAIVTGTAPAARTEPEASATGPSSVEVAVAFLSEHYRAAGVTPFDIMRWPYEAVLTLVDELLPAVLSGGAASADGTPRGRAQAGIGTWTPQGVAAHGAGYMAGTLNKTEH